MLCFIILQLSGGKEFYSFLFNQQSFNRKLKKEGKNPKRNQMRRVATRYETQGHKTNRNEGTRNTKMPHDK